MPEYTKDEALAFINSIRLTLGNKTGFRWLVEKLSQLAAYVEALAAENERLNAYLDWANARGDYESYCAMIHGNHTENTEIAENLKIRGSPAGADRQPARCPAQVDRRNRPRKYTELHRRTEA